MRFNIAIVDDNLTDTARLKGFIHNWFSKGNHELGMLKSYDDGENFLNDFSAGKFNIIFMDILMPGLDGISTAESLRMIDNKTLIVFMTTSREYALDAFSTHPFDYVIKPSTKKNVDAVLDEIVRVREAIEPKVTLKISGKDCTFPVRLISSAASQGHHVEIILTDGRHLLSGMNFYEVEEVFSKHKDFLLCNRGVFVNMSHIASQEEGVFIMNDGTRFPIKIREKLKIKAAFAQFLILNMRTEL